MRAFIAIEISNEDVISSVKNLQSKINISARPVESENFHFTLQFLGEISEDLSQKIIRALHTIKFSSFSVNLKGLGAFPNPKSPRIIWIGTDVKGGKMLIHLAKKVEKVLEPFGLFPDKSFKPHITIFRIKKKIADITKEMDAQKMEEFGWQKVTSIKFKKSELTSNGPIYTDLEDVKAVQ